MKYFIYARKSSEGDERQALSLPAQERELKELALNKNIEILDTFLESKSARKPNNRPLFKQMIERINKGEAKGVICWHINRLSRNWEEAGMLMQMLTDHTIEEIITPDRTITIENSNDIVLGVEFGASSQYSKELSKNIRRGLREKRERGQYTHPAPNFYMNVGASKFDKNIAPREDAHYFEELVDYVIKEDATYKQATAWLNERKIKTNRGNPFYKSSVQKMLKNPVYCGRFKNHRDKKGKWEPLISETKYKKLQEILGNRIKPRYYSHAKGYRGLITCAHCGCAITCTHKIKNGRSYIYYHCTKTRGNCPQVWLKEKELEDQIFDNISKIEIDKEFMESAKEQIKETHKKAFKNFTKRKQNITKQIEERDNMLNELMDMRLKKQLSQDEYLMKKDDIGKQKEELKEELSDKDFNHDSWVSNVETFFETCHRIEDIFNESDIENRSVLVKSLGKNLTLEEGMLHWNFRKPWSLMLEGGNHDSRTQWWRWGH